MNIGRSLYISSAVILILRVNFITVIFNFSQSEDTWEKVQYNIHVNKFILLHNGYIAHNGLVSDIDSIILL